ncbi:hypothetical protein [Streptomyces sp. NPDC012616]
MEGSSVAQAPEVLRTVESLPLNRLVVMSGGRLDAAHFDSLLDRTP